MWSLFLSFLAFVVTGYYAKRYLDDMGMPKGMTRSVWIFCVSAAVSYLVAFNVDWIVT
jgi:hypothetical protein